MASVTLGELVSGAAEVAASFSAALVAGYVRARGEPEPWTIRKLLVRLADAFVCSLLAMAFYGWMQLEDSRVLAGISAAFGLLGTSLLGDVLQRWLKQNVETRR